MNDKYVFLIKRSIAIVPAMLVVLCLHNFPWWHITRGLTGRMLSKVIHIMGSSIRIPHQILIAAISCGNV